MLEDFKNRFSIQEYSACQTSLEQIFNVFALQAGQKHMDDVSHSKKTDWMSEWIDQSECKLL